MRSLNALPQIVIKSDRGVLIKSELQGLNSIKVQQRLSMPTQCELVFRDPPGPLKPLEILAHGASLSVGIEGERTSLFEGQITAVEYLYQPDLSRELHIRAYDLLHRLRKRKYVQAHSNITAEDLARDYANDLGLDVEADTPGPTWKNLYQYDQSNLALLVEVTERSGLYFTLREDTLHLITLGGLSNEVSQLSLGENLLEARIEINGEQASDSIQVIGWDPLQVKTHLGGATSARSSRQVKVGVSPADVEGDEEWMTVDQGTADSEHADGLAQAELDRRSAGAVTLWGVADGSPNLRPGSQIDVENLTKDVDGMYTITEATHTINEEVGFISEISTQPPPPRKRKRAAVSTLGVVSQVADPDDLGRVRVVLPTYNDIESDWLEVLTAAAGPDKGLIAIPEIGDNVLVLLTHGDPSQGIVMGGLFGMDGPPDSGVESGEVQRYTLLTRGGQRIQLDDSGNLIRLENSDGSFIELAPGMVKVHSQTSLEIEAPGKSIVIRGKSIDFQTG
jgi:uncharacterized protein involved in type VI secretion and phage assembly